MFFIFFTLYLIYLKEAEEDDIWKLFEPCGKIESVRLIRDSKTGIGKGFGYVNFESSDSVELALQMEKFTLKGRDLRVSIYKGNVDKKKVSILIFYAETLVLSTDRG